MDLEDEVTRACKRMIERKIENAREQRRALIDTCIQSAVKIIEHHNERFSQTGIRAGGNYVTGGYEANYCGESINGTITIVEIDYDTAEVKQSDKKPVITVNCKAHSCVTRTDYKGKIPESDIIEFIEYATRRTTLIDRWRKMTKEYHGEI